MDEPVQRSVSADVSQTGPEAAGDTSPGAAERQTGRRGFLKTAGALGAIGTVAAGAYSLQPEAEAATAVHYGMVIDLTKCIGCRACAVACKAENGVRLGGFRSWVSDEENGTFPDMKRRFLPRLCNHCERALCVKVCPTGASHRREDGIVDIDKTRCIGCRHCMGACPYNARYFNPAHNPEGEQRFPACTHGTVDKCTFCHHRVDQGVVPACVNTCPAKARVFGDMHDPESEISRLYAREAVTILLPEFGTKPSVFYVGAQVPKAGH